MNHIEALKDPEWGLATDVRPFAEACLQSAQLREAYDTCRGACLVEWEILQHLRPKSADDVLRAATLVLTRVQALLGPLEGERLASRARIDFHLAHAYAASAAAKNLGTSSGDYKVFDLQRAAAGGHKPLVVCYGERGRYIQTKDEMLWVNVEGGDGCGLVHRKVLGKHNADKMQRFVCYCPNCNRWRKRKKESHEARVRKYRDQGFLNCPLFDDRGEIYGWAWVGACTSCGSEVATTDVRVRRCEDCRKKHRRPTARGGGSL